MKLSDFGLPKKVCEHELVKHETKRKILKKFMVVAIIFVSYLIIMTLIYGVENGIMISLLTWSLFVFCTPIADAGFLVDFPVRILTKIRMIYSEMLVWVIAGLINIYALLFVPEVYDKLFLLTIFKQILLNPIPFWFIIILSAAGTFLSVYFGDELIDIAKHKDRKKHFAHKNKHIFLLASFGIVVLILIMYYVLLSELGISL